jgi:hypothetical protein
VDLEWVGQALTQAGLDLILEDLELEDLVHILVPLL